MKATIKITLFLIILLSLTIVAQFNINVNANPISIPQVPSIRGGPIDFFNGYVNSTLEFEINVNTYVDSPILKSISYSLDGAALVNASNLRVSVHDDYGPTKIDFKTYTVKILLSNLSEGNHKLIAYANGMILTSSFTVNSYYHLTALNVISPNSGVYSNAIPVNFQFTGTIKNAHYYLYRGQERVLDKPLTSNMTIENLPDGLYDLYIFVTTEFGQDSKTMHFIVIGNPIQYILILIVIIALIISGILVFTKKRKRSVEF